MFFKKYQYFLNIPGPFLGKGLPNKTLLPGADNSCSLLYSSYLPIWYDRKEVLLLTGLGSGFMAGLLGVGGGAVVVPALTLCTSMDHYTALGTSLAAMVFPAIVGTATHFKKGNVNLRVAPALAVGALVGAYGGGRLGVHVEEDLLRYGFSGLMLGLGLKTFFKV